MHTANSSTGTAHVAQRAQSGDIVSVTARAIADRQLYLKPTDCGTVKCTYPDGDVMIYIQGVGLIILHPNEIEVVA